MSKLERVVAAASVESLDHEEGAERRSEPRIPQSLRTVHFAIGEALLEFRLKTISLRGASGLTEQPLEPGQGGMVLFEGGRSIPASVRWTRDRLAGLYFATPLPLDLLHARPRGASRGPEPRAPRYSIARPATLICAGDRRFQVEIRNISEGGMLIFGRPVVLPGQVVEIVCGAAPLLRGQVRWVRNGFAGLQFAAPISLDDFDEHSRV